MTVEFTSIAKVKAAISGLGSPVPDADITEMIEQVEGRLRARLRLADTFAYVDGTKRHKILCDAATCAAAMKVITAVPMSYYSYADATLALNVLCHDYDECMQILNNENAVDFMAGT
jgi:hypothetical protein